MCGIYGAASWDGPLGRPEVLPKMAAALRHRGPDGHVQWTTPRVALGVDRLRIVDRHERADQPFASADGKVWLACNGEIYNAPDLRRAFPAYPFRSRSDVESLLPHYLERGIECVDGIDGMFGLAVWDEAKGTLLLARDRAGEKPLFYARVGREIWFASEIQALLEHPEVSRDLDRTALDQFLALGYVVEPRTMFAGVRQIHAGTILRFRADGDTEHRYWWPRRLVEGPPPADATAERLESLIESAVRKQVVADVPVGVFTSGGLDSTLLATLAVEDLGPRTVHTFGARFTAPTYDESVWARRLASDRETIHHEVVCDGPALISALRTLSGALAEPLSDPAILPTYLLSRCAREERVTVLLGGEGADELFGGYPAYLGHKFAPIAERLPRPLMAALRWAVARLPASGGRVPLEFLLKRFMASIERPWCERHLTWTGTGLGRRSGPSAWREEVAAEFEGLLPLPGAMLLDYRLYLRDDLLVKVDRASMLNSVEARAPFLDRDVSAFGLSLPAASKIRGMTTKWLLKRASRSRVGADIVNRRKQGLSVPVAALLNEGLRDEVDRLLAPGRLRAQELVDAGEAARLLAEHRSGRLNHARALWPLLILQLWIDRWMPELGPSRA
jgi:asparagine synthase (glutamine-hydrolysing)